MQIEVSTPTDATPKDKGDLLENLAKHLLESQGYTVSEQIRFTGIEIDLLCVHKVSGKRIYVECKAHKDKIDSTVIKNLIGALTIYDYSEVWLISTSELGKDAKGLMDDWKRRPQQQSERVSFYGPKEIIDSLIDSKVIATPPKATAIEMAGGINYISDFILNINKFGRFWYVGLLTGGITEKILVHFGDGSAISDEKLLENLSELPSSNSGKSFISKQESVYKSPEIQSHRTVSVVPIQFAGKWNEYKPANPKEFIGRTKEITNIFHFFEEIRLQKSSGRVFSITGDSGMGKSSLLAKIISKCENVRHRNIFFAYGVDVRAATNSNYISSSLLACLKGAQARGFGDPDIDLSLTDTLSPLSSISISSYLQSVELQNKIICLMFDQFEELFTRPELSSIFDNAKQLFLDVVSAKACLCLGFAWKTDSTLPSNHTAYHFWHSLNDYRYTQKLSPYSDGEISSVINSFENATSTNLIPELRFHLNWNSQGLPWLLRKLCIHVFEKLTDNSQHDLINDKLDVESLFSNDLANLSVVEHRALKMIANSAPINIVEIADITGLDSINQLQAKRLINKTGEMVNIYWDLFREYLLTGKPPKIPFFYLPSSEPSQVLEICEHLNPDSAITIDDLSLKTTKTIGSIRNIASDLVMFGVADRSPNSLSLNKVIPSGVNSEAILMLIRERFSRHIVVYELQENHSSISITSQKFQELLKSIFTRQTYSETTWIQYSGRLLRWLQALGYISWSNNALIYIDRGAPTFSAKPRHSEVFSPSASPKKVCEIMDLCKKEMNATMKIEHLPKGARNAGAIINRLGIGIMTGDTIAIHSTSLGVDSKSLLINTVLEIKFIQDLKIYLASNPTSDDVEIGKFTAGYLGMDWSLSSQKRNGNGLRQWVKVLFT